MRCCQSGLSRSTWRRPAGCFLLYRQRRARARGCTRDSSHVGPAHGADVNSEICGPSPFREELVPFPRNGDRVGRWRFLICRWLLPGARGTCSLMAPSRRSYPRSAARARVTVKAVASSGTPSGTAASDTQRFCCRWRGLRSDAPSVVACPAADCPARASPRR